ncbi:MAG: hypothetical protein ACTHW1_06970 [Ancrocorticia sp.]|uniref:hypothetical protein n=1 Tax=Ancrocorticia sp. TaxID=2593684 RepID=UPI003F91EE00
MLISSESANGDGIIYGGKIQNDDPSSWDYVPEETQGIGTLSAWGQAWIGGFSVKGNYIPRFVLTHDITGSGTKIQQEKAYAVSTTGRICDYRIDWQNRSTVNNGIFSTVKGKHQAGCHIIGTTFGGNNSKAPYTVKKGKQCARLFSSGVFVGEQCHKIS